MLQPKTKLLHLYVKCCASLAWVYVLAFFKLLVIIRERALIDMPNFWSNIYSRAWFYELMELTIIVMAYYEFCSVQKTWYLNFLMRVNINCVVYVTPKIHPLFLFSNSIQFDSIISTNVRSTIWQNNKLHAMHKIAKYMLGLEVSKCLRTHSNWLHKPLASLFYFVNHKGLKSLFILKS